jgi:hypothetical protein
VTRFVLRYQGDGDRPPRDVTRVRRTRGATVLDESPRMLLVEADRPVIDSLLERLDGWAVAEETTVPLPHVRPVPRRRRAG